MATSAVRTFAGVNVEIWDVTATADGDTEHIINHGLSTGGALEALVILLPILQAPAALSAWANNLVNDTDVRVQKSTAVGSGDPAAQLRVVIIAQRAKVLG